MEALLQFIISNLFELWPVRRVDEWEVAILIRRGIIIRELQPGIRWRIPFIDEVHFHPKNECVINLATATIETNDGKIYAISANIAYMMVSMTTCWKAVNDFEESVALLTLGKIASYLSSKSSEDLRTSRGTLETAIKNTLNNAVKEWGVKITRVHLTDSVRVRAIRHYVEGINSYHHEN